ncbi:beta-propeller fold lactonase family protein [Candidatus Poribacteria bacterium]|nr:beta-propeller fold lactonase family protein [Candidatus Poribacteria bacterium]
MQVKRIVSVLYWLFLVWVTVAKAEEIKTVPLYSGRVGSFASPTRIAVNPKLKRIYVTCQDSDNIAVIDGVSNSITGAVSVGRSPLGIAVDPDAGRIYISNQGDDTVSVIGEQNLTIIATVKVGGSPGEIAVDSKGNRVYVVNGEDNSVSVVDGSNFTVVTTVKVGKDPRGIAVNTDANEIYVANNVNDTISVIKGQDYSVVSIDNVAVLKNVSISGNNKPNGIGFDPNAKLLYVANAGTNTVNVIDTKTFKIVATTPVGNQPQRIAINPNTGRAYVSNLVSHTVSVISSRNYDVVDTIDGIGGFPGDIAIDPIAGRLYLKTDANDVYAIDAGSGRVLRQITFWGGLSEIRTNASGERLYIADRSADSVVAVDPQTLLITATGYGGRNTRGIGINDRMNEIYVANGYGYFDDVNTFILDGVTLKRIDSVETGGSTNTVGIDNQRDRVYIAVGWGNKVMVVDGKSHRVIKETIQVGTGPVSVAVNSETNKIYVVGEDSNTVSVIDGDRLEVIATVRVGGSPQGVAVNSKTNRIYVSNWSSNSVSVIDGNSSTVINTIKVGSQPRGIATNPRTNEVYVANYWGSTVSIIDGNTQRVVANVNTGRHPWGVAVHPQRDTIYVTNYGEGSITVISDLIRGAFPTPPLVSPASDEAVYSLTPTLRWTSVSNAVSYVVQVAEDVGFNKVIVDESNVKALQYTISSGILQYSKLYYWRIKARYSKGLSDWSSTWNLNVGGPSFALSLSKGLNFISLPLKPDTPYTARAFLKKLEATLVIRYDAPSQTFVPFVPEASQIDGFVIEGGQGYIVNVLGGKQVLFTGTFWTNAPPASPEPSADKENIVWAFAVAGVISAEANLEWPFGELQVMVRNQRTGRISQSALLSDKGEFATAFVDMNRKGVIRAGDTLEITVRNSREELVSVPLVREISEIDLAKATVVVNLSVGEVIPSQSQLFQNYPNPFNPETWIPFQLAESAEVTIRIYNVAGQLVRTLNLGSKSAGRYLDKKRAAYWDGRNEQSEKISSGVYFYSIEAGIFKATKKLIVTK